MTLEQKYILVYKLGFISKILYRIFSVVFIYYLFDINQQPYILVLITFNVFLYYIIKMFFKEKRNTIGITEAYFVSYFEIHTNILPIIKIEQKLLFSTCSTFYILKYDLPTNYTDFDIVYILTQKYNYHFDYYFIGSSRYNQYLTKKLRLQKINSIL